MASLDQMWAGLNDGTHIARRQQIIKDHDNGPMKGRAYLHNPEYKAEYDKRREDLFAFKQKLNKEGGGWYGSKYHLESKARNRAIKAAAGLSGKDPNLRSSGNRSGYSQSGPKSAGRSNSTAASQNSSDPNPRYTSTPNVKPLARMQIAPDPNNGYASSHVDSGVAENARQGQPTRNNRNFGNSRMAGDVFNNNGSDIYGNVSAPTSFNLNW